MKILNLLTACVMTFFVIPLAMGQIANKTQSSNTASQISLDFANPPKSVQTSVYWYWILITFLKKEFAVRYCFTNDAKLNLFGMYGLPLVAFRAC